MQKKKKKEQKTGAGEDDAATVAGTEVQKADSHHQSAKNVSALSRGSVLAHLESEVCELKKEKKHCTFSTALFSPTTAAATAKTASESEYTVCSEFAATTAESAESDKTPRKLKEEERQPSRLDIIQTHTHTHHYT